jgi:hypothetical protein
MITKLAVFCLLKFKCFLTLTSSFNMHIYFVRYQKTMACMPGCPPPAYYPPPPPPGGAAYYPQGPPAPYGAPAQPAIIPVPVMCAPPAPAPAAAPAASSSAAAASASAASGQQAQQQQSSTSVVVVGMGDKNGKVYEHYYYAMCLACIVFWCCNPLCGLIAFFLASKCDIRQISRIVRKSQQTLPCLTASQGC